MEALYDILSCSICLEQYDLTKHIPYVLKCGHTICQTVIQAIFGNYGKDKITCPICKQVLTYEDPKNIPQNILIMKTLKQLVSQKSDNYNATENILKQCDVMIQWAQSENDQIDKITERIVNMGKNAKLYNNQIIYQLQGYRKLIKDSYFTQILEGKEITNQQTDRVKKDVQCFHNVFIPAKNFLQVKPEEKIKELHEKIKVILNYEVVVDYSTFKSNVFKQMDLGNLMPNNYKHCLYPITIDKKKFPKVYKLIEKLSLVDIDDACIYSFLNYYGVGVEADPTLARLTFDKISVENNGRALLLKFIVFGQKKRSDLLKSIISGYYKSYLYVQIHWKEMFDSQKKKMLTYAAAELGCPIAMNEFGEAIEHVEADYYREYRFLRIKYFQKALKNDYLSEYAKKACDKHYKHWEKFRKENPNYVKWGKDWAEYKKQEIVLL